MTEKEFTITYDKNAAKIILIGSFLSEVNIFRQHFFKAVYMKGDYDALDQEAREKPRTIQFVMINCPGGSVSDMFALLAILRFTKKELPNLTFNLFCCGRIQSAATLFMACEVFSSVVFDRHCTMLIHSVESSFKGDNSFKKRRLESLASSVEQTEQMMCQIYSESSQRRGKSGTDWKKQIETGNDKADFTAYQVLDMGLCDEIL